MSVLRRPEFLKPLQQIAPQAKNFETPPGKLGKFWDFRSPCARSARKILGVFALENSVFNEFWVCLLQKNETPPGQIDEFLIILKPLQRELGNCVFKGVSFTRYFNPLRPGHPRVPAAACMRGHTSQFQVIWGKSSFIFE